MSSFDEGKDHDFASGDEPVTTDVPYTPSYRPTEFPEEKVKFPKMSAFSGEEPNKNAGQKVTTVLTEESDDDDEKDAGFYRKETVIHPKLSAFGTEPPSTKIENNGTTSVPERPKRSEKPASTGPLLRLRERGKQPVKI